VKLLSIADILGAALRSIDEDCCNVNLDMIFFCVDTALSDCVEFYFFSQKRHRIQMIWCSSGLHHNKRPTINGGGCKSPTD
jgi:hypothetical protein